MGKPVLFRHGQSVWSLENGFTGWTDLDLSDDKITGLNIPAGFPLVYELDENLNAIRHYYLGDQKQLEAAAAKDGLMFY